MTIIGILDSYDVPKHFVVNMQNLWSTEIPGMDLQEAIQLPVPKNTHYSLKHKPHIYIAHPKKFHIFESSQIESHK